MQCSCSKEGCESVYGSHVHKIRIVRSIRSYITSRKAAQEVDERRVSVENEQNFRRQSCFLQPKEVYLLPESDHPFKYEQSYPRRRGKSTLDSITERGGYTPDMATTI